MKKRMHVGAGWVGPEVCSTVRREGTQLSRFQEPQCTQHTTGSQLKPRGFQLLLIDQVPASVNPWSHTSLDHQARREANPQGMETSEASSAGAQPPEHDRRAETVAVLIPPLAENTTEDT